MKTNPAKQTHRRYRPVLTLLSLFAALLWAGAAHGGGLIVSADVDLGAALQWGAPYDPYEYETFSTSGVDIQVVPDWYGDRWEHDRDPYITIHVRPYEPSHLMIFGVTEWGELILLYPQSPVERVFYEPALLHISMAAHPWVTAEDMTIFAVSAPYPLLPYMPRYLVPARWFDRGFHVRHHRYHRAIEFGFVTEWNGFYWVIGDPFESAWNICSDFWWASGCRVHRPAFGYRIFHPRNRHRHDRYRDYPHRPRPPHIRHERDRVKFREVWDDPRPKQPHVRGKAPRPNPPDPNPVRISPERPGQRPDSPGRPGVLEPRKKPVREKMKPINVEKKSPPNVRDRKGIERPKPIEIRKRDDAPRSRPQPARPAKPKKPEVKQKAPQAKKKEKAEPKRDSGAKKSKSPKKQKKPSEPKHKSRKG